MKRFFHSLNPLAMWRQERALDREMVMTVATELSAVLTAQATAMAEQAKVMQKWMENLTPIDPEPPTSRVTRDEDELQMIAARMGLTLDEYLGTFRNA